MELIIVKGTCEEIVELCDTLCAKLALSTIGKPNRSACCGQVWCCGGSARQYPGSGGTGGGDKSGESK